MDQSKKVQHEMTVKLGLCAYEIMKNACDENRIFPIQAILKHKQVDCMRKKMLFTTLKYLFSFQRYSNF